jgi:hypothetical protein
LTHVPGRKRALTGREAADTIKADRICQRQKDSIQAKRELEQEIKEQRRHEEQDEIALCYATQQSIREATQEQEEEQES